MISLVFFFFQCGSSGNFSQAGGDSGQQTTVVSPYVLPTTTKTITVSGNYASSSVELGQFKTVTEAVANATCDTTIVIEPGVYEETVNIGGYTCKEPITDSGKTFNCPADKPLVIRARNPVVGDWMDGSIGAGPLNATCILVNKTDNPCGDMSGEGCFDRVCDHSIITHVKAFETCATYASTQNESNIIVHGIETHQIAFVAYEGVAGTSIYNGINVQVPKAPQDVPEQYKGCNHCSFVKNFLNVNWRVGLSIAYSDDNAVLGNLFYRMGGDESLDDDIGTSNGLRVEMANNDLVGSGAKNGVGLHDGSGLCDKYNWETAVLPGGTACADSLQGTDGWTNHAEYSCGQRFHHNKIYNKQVNADDGSDADGTDIKLLKCFADPIEIDHNEYYNNAATPIIIHEGASGINIHDNIIHDNAQGGILIQAGQECNDYAEYCSCDAYCAATTTASKAAVLSSYEIDADYCTCSTDNIAKYATQCDDYYWSDGDHGDISNVRITGNTIYNNPEFGISIKHVAPGSDIEDRNTNDSHCVRFDLKYKNELSGEEMARRSIYNVTIEGNNIHNNTLEAISVQFIYDAFDPAFVSSKDPVAIFKNTIQITGNTLTGNDTASTLFCTDATVCRDESTLTYNAEIISPSYYFTFDHGDGSLNANNGLLITDNTMTGGVRGANYVLNGSADVLLPAE